MIATIKFFSWFADKFEWISRFGRNFSEWFVEHQRRNILLIFGIFVGVSTLLTMMVNVLPRPSNIPSTPLNTSVSFGTLNKSATLTESIFNEKNGVMELHYTITDGSQATQNYVDINQIKFTAEADHGGDQVTGKYIPTSSNTVVVQFKNLSHKFNAVTVTVHDKSVNTADIDAPSSSSLASSSSNKNQSKSNNNLGKFTINRDKVTRSNSLVARSQMSLEIAEYQNKIKSENTVISKNKKAIIAYNKAINQENDAIKNYQKQLNDSSDSTIQTDIENSRNNITQIRSQISDAENNISQSQDKISNFEKTISRVKAGNSQLPKPTKM